jgi:hypothetical protein
MMTFVIALFAKLSSLDPKTKGRIMFTIFSLLFLLIPPMCVYFYMRGEIKESHALGQVECERANGAALLKGNQEALAAWKTTQGNIINDARTDSKTIAAALEEARGKAVKLNQELQANAIKHPLPADCRADADSVRVVNAARSQN